MPSKFCRWQPCRQLSCHCVDVVANVLQLASKARSVELTETYN